MYLVYCPFPNMNEAKCAAKELVESNACVCANILKSYSSMYKWQGKLAEESEFVLIAKTQDERVEALESKIKEMNSNSIPAIMRIKVDNVNKEYLQWCGTAL